ncbi:MAG: alpha/beta hydrolase [Moraxellaceae bacterium]|nr:alpha/beta hydrolase [Moraxellaceae bacterium]
MSLIEYAINLNNKSARYYQYHNENSDTEVKPPLHFYGGNGFVAGVYQPLFHELSDKFDICSLAMRGYWYDKPTAKILTREDDANMLIEFLEKTQSEPVIGVGHSQGATATAIACAKRPDLFHSVYCIEPVTFTKAQAIFYHYLPRPIKSRYEPFKSTLTKQSHWATIEDYYQFLRNHKAFKRVTDEHLYLYAKESLIACENGKGYQLLFAPEQELANYFGTPFIDPALKAMTKVKVPYYVISGKPNMFMSEKVRKSWQSFIKPEQLITLADYGHMLPVEAPKLVTETLINCYK